MENVTLGATERIVKPKSNEATAALAELPQVQYHKQSDVLLKCLFLQLLGQTLLGLHL